MKLTMKRTALALALAGVFSIANASVLVAGTPTASVDVVAGNFGGTLVDSAITLISNSSYNGIARTAVYDTGTGMDFYYQFSNNESSANGVERFTGFNFSSLGTIAVNVFQTNAAFGIFTTGSEKSDYADRTPTGVIGFNFVPNGHSPIDPGLTSYIEIIRTVGPRTIVPGNFGLLDGIGDNAKGFAPAVPEPATNALLLSGIGMIGFIGRRRLAKGVSGLLNQEGSGLALA